MSNGDAINERVRGGGDFGREERDELLRAKGFAGRGVT